MGSTPIIHLILWNNLINSKVKKTIVKESLNLDQKMKKISIINAAKEEENKKFLDNLETIKNRINNKELSQINNWDSYKKKDMSIGIKKKEINKIPNIGLIINLKIILIRNLIENIMFFYKINENTKTVIKYPYKNTILNKFLRFNLKKLNAYKNNNYFTVQSIVVIILDIKYLKSKISIMNKFKCLGYLTNGMMFKKLQLRNKKYKKSEKLTYLMIKSILTSFNFLKNYKNIIIHIKGIKKNFSNVLSYLNKKLEKNKNIIFISNTCVSRNKYFKFKKIKAIKRRLKKKLIKYK